MKHLNERNATRATRFTQKELFIATRNFKIAFFLFIVVLMLLFFAFSAFAQKDLKELPIGLQKIIESNQKSTSDFALKISFFIAFVAGILGILSPCILPFLPAYFSYTFKEKRNITKMTLIFFLGFSLIFVALGVISGFIGEQTMAKVQLDWLVTIAGLFIIFLGIITLMEKGICTFINHDKFKNDTYGTFLFGMSFGVGWSACLGPILAGILSIGVILGNVWYSALLLFFYSLGNLVPLFLLSIFYDKFNLSENRFIKGKVFTVSIFKPIFKKEYYIHSTNLISGILLMIIGLVLVIYKNTAIANRYDLFGTKEYFYTLQRQLINWEYANILGIAIFLLFILILIISLWKYSKQTEFK